MRHMISSVYPSRTAVRSSFWKGGRVKGFPTRTAIGVRFNFHRLAVFNKNHLALLYLPNPVISDIIPDLYHRAVYNRIGSALFIVYDAFYGQVTLRFFFIQFKEPAFGSNQGDKGVTFILGIVFKFILGKNKSTRAQEHKSTSES